jgi:hypothetical protein
MDCAEDVGRPILAAAAFQAAPAFTALLVVVAKAG